MLSSSILQATLSIVEQNSCSNYANATALWTAFDTARASTGTKTIAICASSTPITWTMAPSSGGFDDGLNRITLNANSNQVFKLLCVIRTTSDFDRCIIDFAPAQGVVLDSSSQYGGFVLGNQNQLLVNGFEFNNYKTKGPMFYNGQGSTLTIQNSVFKE